MIQNAAEASAESGKSTQDIKVRTSIENEIIAIEVEDQGPGIPEDQLKTLFTDFKTTKEKGSGIGLKAIHRISNDHNARVSVTSAVGVGTVFRVEFYERALNQM